MKTFASPKTRFALAGVALLLAGGGVGSAITHAVQPERVMAAAPPVRIASLATLQAPLIGAPIATVRGRIVEQYGRRVVLDDGSGRVLVETGPDRAGGPSFAVGQTITAQGRYDEGSIHAIYLIGADGRAYAAEPPHGPHPGPGGPGGPEGPRPPQGDRGPGDGAPPPPPPAGGAPAPMPGAAPVPTGAPAPAAAPTAAPAATAPRA